MVQTNTLGTLCEYLGPRAVDVFICCASFESRCKSISMNLNVSSVGSAVIFVNQDYAHLASRNVRDLEQVFVGKHTTVELDTTNPLLTADRISSSLARFTGAKSDARIVIDITSFTRESLLILFKYLFDRQGRGYSVEFLYANAKEYSIGDVSKDKWLSKGNREVRSVIGYPGVLVPSRQCHLIVLVGFEDQRALSLINECEPARISLGIGDELEWATAPHQCINVDRMRRLTSAVGVVHEFKFSGYDARGTKQTVEKIVDGATGYNTVIAPMNTKISTLGAAMVALVNESVQVCYAQANIYNARNYSEPGMYFFHLSMAELM